MRLRQSLPALLPLALLIGCNAINSPSALYPNVTGNWQFQVQLPAQPTSGPIVLPTNPIKEIFGSLSSSGNSVTAILHAAPLAVPHCVEMDTPLAFTGTTDSSGNLSLTAPLGGGTATISANLLTLETVTLSDGTIRTEPFFAGTYQVIGGTCAQAPIPLTIFSVSNITGTFTETATGSLIGNPNPQSTTITATFVEASAPDANGKYALSGNVTSTGGCNATYSFTSGIVAGDMAQSAYFLNDTTPLPPNQTLPVFQGSITPSPPQPSILGNFQFNGCSTTYTAALNQTP